MDIPTAIVLFVILGYVLSMLFFSGRVSLANIRKFLSKLRKGSKEEP
jgi:hypothetical protein